MIEVSELNNMPKSSLVMIYKSLNNWGWSDLLGEKPEGWDTLPNYKKPYMDNCLTKADIIRPYMAAINKIVPHHTVYP